MPLPSLSDGQLVACILWTRSYPRPPAGLRGNLRCHVISSIVILVIFLKDTDPYKKGLRTTVAPKHNRKRLDAAIMFSVSVRFPRFVYPFYFKR